MKSLGLIDLDYDEMIMALEDTFNVQFSDEKLDQCSNVGQLFEYLKQLLPCSEISGKCIKVC